MLVFVRPANPGCGAGGVPNWDRNCNDDGCQGCDYYYHPLTQNGVTVVCDVAPPAGTAGATDALGIVVNSCPLGKQVAPTDPWNSGNWKFFAGKQLGGNGLNALVVEGKTKFQSYLRGLVKFRLLKVFL